mmetsp:Transcript_86194/g.139840  ORF Transcript_86194/g.139840 Transcript_86194/m.139840 type:complete len:82 (-) Transcript_86194:449-694(-)
MFAILCFKEATAPMSYGAGPPGTWQLTATQTPLATSTWSSPNGIPYGVGGPLPACLDQGVNVAFSTAGPNVQATQQNAFNF